MKIFDAFPSNYIKASDLNGKPWDMEIRTVALEDLGQGNDKESKPVLYFDGAQKGLVLNKTNATTIVNSYGEDTGNWTGKDIQVFPTTTEFKGETVDAIRVRVAPEAQPAAAPPAAAAPISAPMVDVELNDEIGF